MKLQDELENNVRPDRAIYHQARQKFVSQLQAAKVRSQSASRVTSSAPDSVNTVRITAVPRQGRQTKPPIRPSSVNMIEAKIAAFREENMYEASATDTDYMSEACSDYPDTSDDSTEKPPTIMYTGQFCPSGTRHSDRVNTVRIMDGMECQSKNGRMNDHGQGDDRLIKPPVRPPSKKRAQRIQVPSR